MDMMQLFKTYVPVGLVTQLHYRLGNILTAGVSDPLTQ